MADQNKPYEENISAPVVESFVPPPPPPTVVVPGGAGGVPKWFYFLFGITVLIFFLVTALLVLSLTQKQKAVDNQAVPTVRPSAAPTQTSAVQATDSATAKLNEMGNSDDTASIEADLKNTDLGVLDQSLNTLDDKMSASF